MKKIMFSILLLLPVILHAQDSVSVLFIGNSYTYVNDLPTIFSNLTLSLGDEATVDSKTNGGYTFQNHLSDPLTQTKIESKTWDYVILQGQSQEPSFPTDQVNNATLPPALALSDSIYENWYCSQAMYFMTWGRQNGDPQWDSINTFDKMNLRLRNTYVRIVDSAQGSVAPVGVAWKYVRDNYPTINLYSADGSHPSAEGSYLSACTIYSSVFRKSPNGANYLFGLDPVVAGILQNAAAICVMDSIDTWHLRSNDEVSIADYHTEVNGSVVQFFNDSWRSTNYQWNFGDGNSSFEESPLHTYIQNGLYSVQLIASSICGEDTIFKNVQINLSEIQEESDFSYKKYSFGNGKFELTGLPIYDLSEMTLIDIHGRNIGLNNIRMDEETETVVIDLSEIPMGFYYLKITSKSKNVIIDLPITE